MESGTWSAAYLLCFCFLFLRTDCVKNCFFEKNTTSYFNEVGLPDGSGCVSVVPPLLGWVDVHAPQLPVVTMAWVLVALHLERVVLDVIDGGKNDPLVVLFYSSQNRLGPDKSVNTYTCTHFTDTNYKTDGTELLLRSPLSHHFSQL